jgi:NTP pyrophosphatase (non-canonical NTP hydrolase)
MRDKGGVMSEEDSLELSKELGDVLWYVSALACEINVSLSTIAEENIDKLNSRQERGKLQGSGDNR